MRKAVAEAPGLVVLAMVVSLWTLVTEDLAFYDEAGYLTAGVDGTFTGGAAYSDMFWLISLVVKDPTNLYFAGRMASATLFVLALWCAVRIHVPARVAWAVAAVAAVIPVAHVWPGVANPAAAIVLICVAAILKWPTPFALSLSAGALWLAAASRPELVYFALAVTLWAFAWVILLVVRRGVRSAVQPLVGLGLSVLVFLALVLKHGTPFDTSRSWFAFGQHYSTRAHLPGEDAWFQWQQVLQRDFPGASSVQEAVLTSPANVARHVASNLADTPRRFVEFALPDFPLANPARLLATVMLIAFIAAVIVALALGSRALVAGLRRGVSRESLRRHSVAITFVALVGAFSLAPLLVIFPRDHYMLILIGFALWLGALIIWRLGGAGFQIWALQVPQTAMFVLFAVLTILAVGNRMSQPPVLLASVAAVKAEGESLNFLAEGPDLTIYSDKLNPVRAEPLPDENFIDYLRRNDITAVLVMPELRFGPLANLPGLEDFMKDPTRAGFRPIVPDSLLFTSR